jgi:hypothetical protein
MPPGTNPLAGRLYLPNTTRNINYDDINHFARNTDHWTYNDWDVMVFTPLQDSFFEKSLGTTIHFIQYLLQARRAVGLPTSVRKILDMLRIGQRPIDLDIFVRHDILHDFHHIAGLDDATHNAAKAYIAKQIEDSVHMIRPAQHPE